MKILSALGLICCFELAAAEPTPFRAVYQANYKGLPINAVGIRELRQIDSDTFLFSSSASTFFSSINEESQFSWDERVIPIEYRYIRQGVGKDKNDLLTFNWKTNTANYNTQNHIIKDGVVDKLAYQLQLRKDLASINSAPWPRMNYMVMEENRLKKYEFLVRGEQDTETLIGKFKTVEIDRVRNNTDRRTTFWLALEHDFLLIKFKQSEPGNTFELLLKQAEINGRPIRGD